MWMFSSDLFLASFSALCNFLCSSGVIIKQTIPKALQMAQAYLLSSTSLLLTKHKDVSQALEIQHVKRLLTQPSLTTPITAPELFLLLYFPAWVTGPLARWSPKSAPREAFWILLRAWYFSLYLIASLAYIFLIPDLCSSFPFKLHSLSPCPFSTGPTVSVLVQPPWCSQNDLILYPTSWWLVHFLKDRAFCTVFRSFYNPAPANNCCIISFSPSWKSFLHLPLLLSLGPPGLCAGGSSQKASSSFFLPHLTCLHASNSSKASLLETALSPQTDMGTPSLCSYPIIRHFVPRAVTVNSPVCLPHQATTP